MRVSILEKGQFLKGLDHETEELQVQIDGTPLGEVFIVANGSGFRILAEAGFIIEPLSFRYIALRLLLPLAKE